MCGIAGIFDFANRGVAEEELRSMATAIRHRGPDDAGWLSLGGHVGLANVRLAVIDVSPGGHQPMATEDGRYTLVYNGELYNYRDLAAELEHRGHSFRSRSDTEVVLRAFAEWGPACLDRFNGMYALAIWDEREQVLFMARDRFGIKPLYYAEYNGRLIFASEIKALLEIGYPASVSMPALLEYFTFQNIFSDLTLFDGVRLLEPGHSLTVRASGVRKAQYWDLAFEPDADVTEDVWVDLLTKRFEEAVTRQLVSDVPIGSYLSGGMDSASIAAVASRSVPRLMTFTGGFDLSSVAGMELVFDERADAEIVARTFRTEHYEMVMHAGDMAWILPELVWHLEDLRVGMSYPSHYIARLASKFVTVTLAGAGGDELFAGYPWRYDLVKDAHDPQEFERLHYGYWTRLVQDDARDAFFGTGFGDALRDSPPIDAYRRVLAPAQELDPVSRALYFEAKSFLHGLLVVEDRLTMAQSLEARVPFLDNELVDLARRIPVALKHSDEGGKLLLRRAMSQILPAEIVSKKKQGFSPPDRAWYRGETMPYIQSTLLDPRSLARGYFQPNAVRQVLAEHFEGKVNHRLLIWSLLCFEWWNRLFIDGESVSYRTSGSVARAPFEAR